MLNKKLLEVLQRLQERDRVKLKRFICSPYFNNSVRSEELIRLYDHLQAFNFEENHPQLQKEYVFNLFFPGKPYKENAKSPLDSLTSELFGMVKHFLKIERLEQENGEVYEALTMARFYRKFGMEERFWQNLDHAKKVQNDSRELTKHFYLRESLIAEEEHQFRGLYNSLEDDINLNAFLHNLDIYYGIIRLEYGSALWLQRKQSPLESVTVDHLENAILTLSTPGNSLDVPAIRLYRSIMPLLQNPTDEYSFQEFERIALDSKECIPREEYKSVMAILRYFYGQRFFRSDQASLSQNIFALHCEHLEKGYLYIDDMIPLTTMYNMVFYAIKAHAYDWAKAFLDNHPPQRICGTRYPKEIHSLCMAEYYFAINDYESAMNNLTYKLFENTFMSIIADVLLVKIYYETEHELLESRMDALTKKIRRSNFVTERKLQYLNFVKKLDKINKTQGKSKRLKLLEEIKATPGIISKDWLISVLSK